MNASRRSQPYRKGAQTRAPGSVLDAILRGGPASLPNPIDQKRRALKLIAKMRRA